MLQVVWFKRDLRISDHAPLAEAARRGPVLPLYIVEPDYWALPDTSGRQWAFIAESLVELRDGLMKLGQPLVVRTGLVTDLLARLHARHGIAHLWSHEETGNLWTFERDRAVQRFCREAGIPWVEIPQNGVVRRLASRDQWQTLHQAFMEKPIVPAPQRLQPLPEIQMGDVPTLSELGLDHDLCPGRQKGGRAAALDLMRSFYAGRGKGYRYEMSSPLTAQTSCSRLSPHLANGTISIREALQRAYNERKRAARIVAADRPVPLTSIDSFIARLHWHCHFIQKLESEPRIETRAVHPVFEARRRPMPPDDRKLRVWCEGTTGFPFVDACMRSLIATGWINFRMRAMLMAFASYHLDLDWRVTGLHIARLFTDYEPGIHWPQVQMQSGQTGINTPRLYNPVKQSLDQDPEGIFTKLWLPELANLPIPMLHQPWLLTRSEQERFGVILGATYPERIVEHEIAAREARERLTIARRGENFRESAKAIFVKHGSRKTRRAPRGSLPGKPRPVQGELDL
jgi:deoxyribodipyrimidine photo-lyase